jgi:hypothetical protein
MVESEHVGAAALAPADITNIAATAPVTAVRFRASCHRRGSRERAVGRPFNIASILVETVIACLQIVVD